MPKRPSPVSARPRPQAFRVHTEELEAPDSFSIETLPDFLDAEAAAQESATEVAVEVAQSRGILARRLISWGGLFFSAVSGFILLALSNWTFGVVVDLFSRSRTLGLIAIGFGAV
ncbi:MAG TPA: TIGR01620 family protein, partial [Methylovirgula sp.]